MMFFLRTLFDEKLFRYQVWVLVRRTEKIELTILHMLTLFLLSL